MIAVPGLVGHASEDVVSDRLHTYSRYIAIVAEQLQAVQQRDQERLRELEVERSHLELEMREPRASTTGMGDDSAIGPLGEFSEMLLTGLAELDRAAQDEQRLQSCWQQLERGALQVARKLKGHRQPRSGSYEEFDSASTQVDVRF